MSRPSAPLILASASPRRRDLMADAGYDFEVVTADVDEEHDEGAPAAVLTAANALRKAARVADDRPDRLVIGADTLVSIDGALLGKPADLAEAARTIGRLAGRTHEVCTSVSLVRRAPAWQRAFSVVTRVTFLPLGPAEIAEYLTLIDPLDKAGAYAAQEHGDRIIASVDGSWTNVVGLPMERLAEELAAAGVFPAAPAGVPASLFAPP